LEIQLIQYDCRASKSRISFCGQFLKLMQVNEAAAAIRYFAPPDKSSASRDGERSVRTTAVSKSDQARALWLSTIAFTACFALWTIFSIIGVQIKNELGLSDAQFGLLLGTPFLTGSMIRLMLGVWTDQYGGRTVYVAVMLSAAVATWLLTFAYDYPTFLLAALG